MKIVSRYKDYYDYVAHVYGGGDPKIVYLRHRLRDLEFNGWSHHAENVLVNHTTKRSMQILDKLRCVGHYDFHYLCVCGKYYLCVIVGGKLEVLDKERHPEQYSTLCLAKRGDKKIEQKQYSHYVGEYDDDLVVLSRKVGAPVFVIEGYKWSWRTGKTSLSILPTIPKLGEIGLAALYPPEQLYQDISYFIGNLMNESPDLKPPVDVADKDRIVQHGFDLKQSFRHRK